MEAKIVEIIKAEITPSTMLLLMSWKIGFYSQIGIIERRIILFHVE